MNSLIQVSGVRFPEEAGMFLFASIFWHVEDLVQEESCFLMFLFVCFLVFSLYPSPSPLFYACLICLSLFLSVYPSDFFVLFFVAWL
jgi:hypothetical protein